LKKIEKSSIIDIIWKRGFGMPQIEFRKVSKIYGKDETKVVALNNVSFQINKGELVVILGASGAGKSTILNIMGGMDLSTSGDYFVEEKNIACLKEKELGLFRRNDIGFVFQFYNLMGNLTALENVEIAGSLVENSMNAKEALEKVGLTDRANNFPSQLSGGEQQRVAIARAIAKNPKLLLCDEPTGALDYNTGKAILKLLQDTCREEGMTVIIITHNLALTPMGDKVIEVKSGKVKKMTINENPVPVERIEW
jgi:putative ABC transport system ATP-binding protein